MKKYIAITFAAAILSTALLSAKSTFFLGVSTGPSVTGYFSNQGSAATMFWNLALTPELKFNQHWGMMFDLGAGGAIAGIGANGDYDTFQTELLIAPYYEWAFSGWWLDAQVGTYTRFRKMFYDYGTVNYIGRSLALGASVGIRAGFSVGKRTDLFGSFRIEPSILDPLAAGTAGNMTRRLAGNTFLTFGARFSFAR